MLKQRSLAIIVTSLLASVLFVSPVQAYNEWVYAEFPVTNSTVANARDYYVYLRSEYQPLNPLGSVAGWFAIYPGNTSPSNFIQVGIYSWSLGTSWFVSLDPNPNNTSVPVIECKRGTRNWYDNSGRHHGCIGAVGDLGINQAVWGRFQLVTYGDGKWIARVRNGTQVADVAFIYNANTTLAQAEVDMEEYWTGFSNPWLNGGFYNYDLKYRTGYYWAHWPSNIGGDFGTANIGTVSNSGSVICPDHYRVQRYVQNNPYLWYAGVGGANVVCSGLLYTGGGPSTQVTSIVGETTGKLMSSENGAACVKTNRAVDGPWEQWQVVDLGSGIMAYRGNNAGKYLSRRSNNELWSEGNSSSSNDARYYRYWINQPFTFRLVNVANNLFVDHHGSGGACTRADTSGPTNDTILRYVAP